MVGNQQLTLLARGKLSQAAGKVCVFQWLEVFVGTCLPDVRDLQVMDCTREQNQGTIRG